MRSSSKTRTPTNSTCAPQIQRTRTERPPYFQRLERIKMPLFIEQSSSNNNYIKISGSLISAKEGDEYGFIMLPIDQGGCLNHPSNLQIKMRWRSWVMGIR